LHPQASCDFYLLRKVCSSRFEHSLGVLQNFKESASGGMCAREWKVSACVTSLQYGQFKNAAVCNV